MAPARRIFLLAVTAGGRMLARTASSQNMLDEKDTQAVALGYVADASRVDRKKNPKFVAGQKCANCSLFMGSAGDAAGPCPLFPRRAVAAIGWCTAWAKKA